jgi:hypothetical protein
MKSIIKISIILTFFYMEACAQIDTSKRDLSNQPILEFFPNQPFLVSIKKNEYVLPDSLGGKNHKGFAVLRLTIDSTGNIYQFYILKLKLIDSLENSIVDYFNADAGQEVSENTPDIVRSIHHFLASDVYNWQVQKNKGGEPEEWNYFDALIRFK